MDIPDQWSQKQAAFLNGELPFSALSEQEQKRIKPILDVWELSATQFCHQSADPEQAWNKIKPRLNQPNKVHIYPSRMHNLRMIQMAAAVVLIAALLFTLWWFNKSPQDILAPTQLVEQTTQRPSELTTLTLSDGSRVTLNANSRIEYPEQFKGEIRKILLSGEAFFEVNRDIDHPFIIQTESALVEVLGTSFNVSAYPEKRTIEVNVRSGKVRLASINKDKQPAEEILHAGYRGWIDKQTGNAGRENTLAPNYLSWLNRELHFNNIPLHQAFEILENTYHTPIKAASAEIGNMPIDVRFVRNDLDFVLDVIARTNNLKITHKGDSILFEQNN